MNLAGHIHFRTFYDFFCIKNYIETQGEDLSTVKVLYASRQFMLPNVLRRWSWCYSYFVWLCGFYYGVFHVESCLVLCSRVVVVFFFLFFFFQSCLAL